MAARMPPLPSRPAGPRSPGARAPAFGELEPLGPADELLLVEAGAAASLDARPRRQRLFAVATAAVLLAAGAVVVALASAGRRLGGASPEWYTGLSAFDGETLFCWSVVVAEGSELALVQAQFAMHAGIFACNDFAVISNRDLGFDQKTRTIPATQVWGSTVDGTSPNAPIFLNAWEAIRADGRYKLHKWVVKADPDCVLLPDRLRRKLGVSNTWSNPYPPPFQAEPGAGVWVPNCDMVHEWGGGVWPMMFGAVEIISREGIDTYYNNVGGCVASAGGVDRLGEDYFMGQCLRRAHLGEIFMQHGDAKCLVQAACSDQRYSAYHPKKDIGSWVQCWEEARMADQWACHAYKEGEDSDWCGTVGVQGNVEHKFYGLDSPCSPCWCCERQAISRLLWYGGASKCLAVDAGLAFPGTHLHVWSCDGSGNMQFQFPEESGLIRWALHPHLCLGLAKSGANEGSSPVAQGDAGPEAVLWKCNDTREDLQWVVPRGAGQIQNRQAPGRCLLASADADGAHARLAECPSKVRNCSTVSLGCHTLLNASRCLQSQDARDWVQGQPCVWCGAGPCTSNGPSRCEPMHWLLDGEGKWYSTFLSKGNHSVSRCWEPELWEVEPVR